MIRNQLPKGMKMRLPSSLPLVPPDVMLYPYIMSNNEVFSVALANTLDCSSSDNSSSCTVGGLGVFTPFGSKVWPPKGDNITPVDLGNGIQGLYLTRGESSQYVFWEQDGLKYAVGLGEGSTKDISKQQMIDMATSMASEPPITSDN